MNKGRAAGSGTSATSSDLYIEVLLELLEKLLEEFRPLAKEMGKFDREKSSTHGWVWLYRQKEAPSR